MARENVQSLREFPGDSLWFNKLNVKKKDLIIGMRNIQEKEVEKLFDFECCIE